jgi:hypothetical protein
MSRQHSLIVQLQKTKGRRTIWPALLAAGLLGLALLGALLRAGPLAAAAAVNQKHYLPVVLQDFGTSGEGIGGIVNDKKSPASGVPLALRRYNGSTTTTEQSTTSGAAGAYLFNEAGSLGAGESYYVRYGPNDSDSDRLYIWFGPDIENYSSGTSVPGGDFDIGDVALQAPADGATVSLPVTFQWQQRGVPGDGYELIIYDPNSDDGWTTHNLGNVGSLTTSKPSGASFGKSYYWYIIVNGFLDSYGVSYFEREIVFSASNAQQTPDGATETNWYRLDRSRETQR